MFSGAAMGEWYGVTSQKQGCSMQHTCAQSSAFVSVLALTAAENICKWSVVNRVVDGDNSTLNVTVCLCSCSRKMAVNGTCGMAYPKKR